MLQHKEQSLVQKLCNTAWSYSPQKVYFRRYVDAPCGRKCYDCLTCFIEGWIF